MADHMDDRVRAGAVTALTGLTTTTTHVYEGQDYPLQDSQLPALRIYTEDRSTEIASLGVSRYRKHELDLVVEAVVKESSDPDGKVDLIRKEVEIALDSNQDLGCGVKMVEPRSFSRDRDADGEKRRQVGRMTFIVTYYTAKGSPDTAV